MALDEALVTIANRLKIGKSNQRLSPDLKSNEATIQVVLDVLKLTLVYNAFLDQSISRRNKMFWHTTRDDPMFNTIRVISRYQDSQIYGAILPDVLTSRDMLESKAYKEYYAFTTEAKRKAKGLTMLTEAALSKADQLKLATKRSKKDFHISHASGSGDGVGKLSKGDSKEEGDDDDGNNDDEGGNNDEDNEDDEVVKDLYDDVNVNLGNANAEMTDADQGTTEQHVSQEEEDAHVTLTYVHDATKADEPFQSYFVSSDFTSKFLNLKNPALTDTEIASLMKTSNSQDTIPPTPPTLFIPVTQQQQTPTLPTTTSITIPEVPDFAFVFKFSQRVLALEIKLSELKQTNQFAEAISSIPGIVDKYLAFKMKEAVDVAVQLQTNKLRKEAQAKNEDFLNQVEKYVTESLGDEVFVRSTNQSHTSYVVAASLFELELRKILMDKMEANKSIE
nr:hypothetical protein [Tanacetum cinerariifolium]